MCQEAAKPIRSVVLFEGQVKWIMERDTPEERLAAWEAISAIAFPDDDSVPYQPPMKPSDGAKLSPTDRVKRDVYNLFKDIIESRAIKNNGKLKDPKKVEAGRMGAAVRFGKRGESSAAVRDDDEETPEVPEASNSVSDKPVVKKDAPKLPGAIANDDFSGDVAGGFKFEKSFTADEKAAIAAWDRRIPNPKALQEFLVKNYLYQNKQLVVSDKFCEYAYHQLAKIDRWISTRDRKPLRDIKTAIHYMALDFMRKSGEIRRAEKVEHSKDLEMDYSDNSADYADKLAADRRLMKQLEREAAEKGLA